MCTVLQQLANLTLIQHQVTERRRWTAAPDLCPRSWLILDWDNVPNLSSRSQVSVLETIRCSWQFVFEQGLPFSPHSQ